MIRGALLAPALFAVMWVPGSSVAATPSRARTAIVLHDNVPVRAKPSSDGHILARLVQQTQVAATKKQHGWWHIRMWASVSGWVRSEELGFRKPWSTTSTYKAPVTRFGPHAAGPFPLSARATLLAATPLARAPGAGVVRTLPAATHTTVSAWAEDLKGLIWYRIGRQWASGASVQFDSPDPGLTRRNGLPLWHAVAGKGMWLTLGTVTSATPQSIVLAAQRNHISHLYLEAAISPLGFHGKQSVGPLLDAAHAARISVVAWVYPYLDDIASDVRLTRNVAAFQTANSQSFDGIAADLERNMDPWRVRAYSQLVRRYTGNQYLLVGVSYPPQSMPTYPFPVLARSYNAIAPMDYWHQTKSSYGVDYQHLAYGYGYGYRYAVDSVAAIRRVSRHVPVTTIGQAFDDFGRLEMGPHAPSAPEIKGFLQGSKSAGAVGVSFFQWMTVTEGEWRAIHAFRF